MEFCKLPANAEALLHEILQADNPVDMLCEKFTGISHKEDEALILWKIAAGERV